MKVTLKILLAVAVVLLVPCMPQLMEKSYTQEEREDMDTV